MKMRSVASLAASFFALMSSAAYADGMVSLKDTPVELPPTWAGPYFGMSIGWGHNDSNNNYRDSDGERSSRDEEANGGLVSLIWGIDCMLRDRVVAGAFIDVDWSDIDRGFEGNKLTIDRSFAVGGRLGYLVTPNTLLFATGGYTLAHFDNEGWWDIDVGGLGTLPGKSGENFSGYFVGGGIETRLNRNFFLRGEVRYADYGTRHTNVGTFLGTSYVDEEDPELITGRLGIVYKLGRGDNPLRDDYGADTEANLKAATYYGVDVSKDIWTVYSGGVLALNGDLARDGVVARTFGYYSDYDYKHRGDDTEFHGKDRAVDVMLGYQKYFGTTSAIAYVGMEVRDIDIDPNDPTNEVQGTQNGFKIAAEIETDEENPFYTSVDASYSTAFNSWYTQLRVGPNMKGVKFGPEGVLFSDEGELTTRVGAFAILPFNLKPTIPAEISFDAGYQFVEDDGGTGGVEDVGGTRGGEGAYFGSMLKVLF